MNCDRPGFIISTSKSGLLEWIETRKTKRYVIEVTDMKSYTGCVVFDYELYDGGTNDGKDNTCKVDHQ